MLFAEYTRSDPHRLGTTENRLPLPGAIFCGTCGDVDDNRNASHAGSCGTPRYADDDEENKSGKEQNYTLPENAGQAVRKFLADRETSTLKAWFRYLDRNQNGSIDIREFTYGMSALRYPGNTEMLWEELDSDMAGTITLDSIDPEEAAIWNVFRRWCGSKFTCARDMVRQLKHARAQVIGPQSKNRRVEESLQEVDFAEGLPALGWEHGFECALFGALDVEGEGSLVVRDMKWMDIEARRFRLKDAAKKRASRMQEQKAKTVQARVIALRDFKVFLLAKFGLLFRAWRAVLDNDGSMKLERAELFKATKQLNWRGDARALWKALDTDGSGSTTLEELDPHCAQLLAHLLEWATAQWGPKCSSRLFHALDRQKRKKLSYAQFVSECEARGFTRKVKSIPPMLDWQNKKYLLEEDLAFLDVWRPPAWLTASPNPQAADGLRRQMLQKCNHYLRAWRILDKDNSNSCNWHEFKEAVKQLKFNGDVPGAWLALDEDLSGFITLREIDASSHDALVEFKRWADEEFGSVRAAFKVMDGDQSNELNYKEFHGASRNFGYQGDIRQLFMALDQQGERKLQMKDVAFLDEWELQMDLKELRDGTSIADPLKLEATRKATALLEYQTKVPGPGAYDILSGFGAAPSMPTARHGGAFSFTCRRSRGMQKFRASPATYTPETISRRKPAWCFGSTPRKLTSVRPDSTSYDEDRGTEDQRVTPGPGSYDFRSTLTGPQFSMKPRRGLPLHPSQRDALTPDNRTSRVRQCMTPTPTPRGAW